MTKPKELARCPCCGSKVAVTSGVIHSYVICRSKSCAFFGPNKKTLLAAKTTWNCLARYIVEGKARDKRDRTRAKIHKRKVSL